MVSIVMSIDIALVRWVRKHESSGITAMMRALTHLGDGSSWTLFALLIASMERSWTGMGMSLGYAALAGSLVAKGIKHQIRRLRPHRHLLDLVPLVKIPDPWSFPSGHTSAAFGVFGLLLMWGSPFAYLALSVSSLIGLSRIYLRAHFPTDVIVGAVLGFFTGWLVYEGLTYLYVS
jgi:undecaprenyl-diphosphatase